MSFHSVHSAGEGVSASPPIVIQLPASTGLGRPRFSGGVFGSPKSSLWSRNPPRHPPATSPRAAPVAPLGEREGVGGGSKASTGEPRGAALEASRLWSLHDDASVTPAQAAAMLGKSPVTLEAWRRQRRKGAAIGPAFIDCSRRPRYRVGALRAFQTGAEI